MTTDACVLEISGLRKSFGTNLVLKGIDLTIVRGEVVAVIGPSGSGKSTLARCMNLIEQPDAGRLTFLGRVFDHDPGRRHGLADRRRRRTEETFLRRHTGMVFQQFNLFPHLTVRQNVTLALCKVKKASVTEADGEAMAQLRRVGLAAKADAYPGTLSGGQQQRVAIARALATQPALMIFDEATSSLDPELTGEVLDVMRALARDGMTMVVITHEMDFAREVAHRAVMMDDGLIHEEGVPAELFGAPRSERTRSFLRHFRRERA